MLYVHIYLDYLISKRRKILTENFLRDDIFIFCRFLPHLLFATPNSTRRTRVDYKCASAVMKPKKNFLFLHIPITQRSAQSTPNVHLRFLTRFFVSPNNFGPFCYICGRRGIVCKWLFRPSTCSSRD